MLSLLKSDIYKIFKRMSFYICMLLAALSSGYSTWVQEQTIKGQMKQRYAHMMGGFMDPSEMYASIDALSGKDLGLSAWSVSMNNLSSSVITFGAIFLTIFISAEFSSGMCKAVLIRGKNKISFYFSKLISCCLIPIMYSLIVCGINFGIGASKWQGYEWKPEYVDAYLIPFGWFLLVTVAWTSLLCFVAFICRGSGLSMAVNLGLITLVPPAILLGLQYIAEHWFNKADIPFSKYWIGSYNQIYAWGQGAEGKISQDAIAGLIWSLSCWFLIPTILGILYFNRREVK